jgi:hypothetical protein
MSELNLILQALAVGVNTALQQTTGKAVSDAYNGLKTLIQHRFAEQPKAQITLTDYEDDPDTYEKPLRKYLHTSQLDQDEEIIAATHHLMNLVQRGNIVHNQISNQGIIQGLVNENTGTINMSFRDPKFEK